LLRAIAEGTAGAVGEEFCACAFRNVAEAFGAKLVFVGEATQPEGRTCASSPAGTTARTWMSRSSTTPRASRAAGGRERVIASRTR